MCVSLFFLFFALLRRIEHVPVTGCCCWWWKGFGACVRMPLSTRRLAFLHVFPLGGVSHHTTAQAPPPGGGSCRLPSLSVFLSFGNATAPTPWGVCPSSYARVLVLHSAPPVKGLYSFFHFLDARPRGRRTGYVSGGSTPVSQKCPAHRAADVPSPSPSRSHPALFPGAGRGGTLRTPARGGGPAAAASPPRRHPLGSSRWKIMCAESVHLHSHTHTPSHPFHLLVCFNNQHARNTQIWATLAAAKLLTRVFRTSPPPPVRPHTHPSDLLQVSKSNKSLSHGLLPTSSPHPL